MPPKVYNAKDAKKRKKAENAKKRLEMPEMLEMRGAFEMQVNEFNHESLFYINV